MAYIIIFWVGASLIVGIIGMERKIGFLWAFLCSIFLTPIIGLTVTLLYKDVKITDKTPLENVFDGLLYIRERIAKDTKNEIIKISKESGISYNKKQIDVNLDIYSLWITSLFIKDEDLKDKYHYHFEIHGGKDQEYLQFLYKKVANHYPKYYEGYNNFVETKSGLILGGILDELLINDNHEFIMPMPKGGIMSSALLVALFGSQLTLVIESIDNLSKKYSTSII